MALTTTFRMLSVFAVLYLAKCEWIDLSYKYNNKTLYWGTSTRFQHKKVYIGSIIENNVTLVPYYSSFDIITAEHGGTHIDAPVHFAEGAWALHEIPAEKLVGDAVVVNMSTKSAADRNAQLTVDDLKKWEEDHGRIPDGSILFVYTGWGKYWGSYLKYFGTSTTNSSLYTFPGIHKDTATWLVKNRIIKGVGIDTPSIDYGKSKAFSTHQILMAKNIYGLENVANLEKLPPTGAIVYALPMNVESGSGGPVRIFATMASGVRINVASGIFAVVFVLLVQLHIL